MKLSIRHAFECAPDRFWDMYWHESYLRQVYEGARREVIALSDEDGITTRRVRFRPDRELPGPLVRLMRGSPLVYEEEIRWERAASRVSWEVVPNLPSGLFTAKGVFEVRPTATGCEQVIDGDIELRVRVIGRRVEKGVIREVTKSWARTAEIGRRWLRANGPGDRTTTG